MVMATSLAAFKATMGGRPPVHESPIVQERIKRVIQLIHLLSHGRFTTKELAPKLNTSPRTVARLLNTVQNSGIELECDRYFQYFIVKDNCPVCGAYNQQPKIS